MLPRTIRIATRQSPLALWQANHVLELLCKQNKSIHVELLPMQTSGDQFLKDKLSTAGGKGLFVKELEEALLTQRADLAVHSAKDMPSEFPEGLCLAAICERHNPFDALISKEYSSLEDLPNQAVVGTASLRRQTQLLAYRPDLQIKTLRGNINTRLAKLEKGEYHAIILAIAGLARLGLDEVITEPLSPDLMLPSCGQGALGIECRTEDQEILELLAGLNHASSALCVQTERLVNAQLGGNCRVPLAVFCTLTPSNELFLRAKIINLDGTQQIQDSQKGPLDQGPLLARLCSHSLLEQGAAELLHSVSS